MAVKEPDSSISGGYILLARKLLVSALMDKPPHYLKLWIWMLMKAFWQNGDEMKRGQLHTTIAEMQKVGGYSSGNRKCLLTIDEVRSAYGFLAASGAIITMKSTRGMVITICNYDAYQSPEHYETKANIQESGTVPDPTRDTTPDPIGEETVTSEKLGQTCENNAPRTPYRTPRRKPAGPHTIDEEYKRSKNTVDSDGKRPSEHRLFTDWFHYGFELVEGDRYVFEGAKDGKLLSGMLKQVPLKELVAKACHYLVDNKRFPEGRPTIAGLHICINRYPGHMNGKTESFRAIGLIPPEGTQLEDWAPWRILETPNKTQQKTDPTPEPTRLQGVTS